MDLHKRRTPYFWGKVGRSDKYSSALYLSLIHILGQSILVLIIRINGIYHHKNTLLSGLSVRMPERRVFYSLRPDVPGRIPVIMAAIDIT